MITKEQLQELSKVGIERASILVDFLNISMKKYSINTKLREQHFLAQILHESGSFKFKVENLNYSDKALNSVFKKYFPTLESTIGYARVPEKIANKVYADRMSNGNEASGDGWKYRGRGALQITGKANYTLLTKDSGVDFINNPSLLETDKYYFEGGAWYWFKNGLNALADADNLDGVSDKINIGRLTATVGDSIGYADRVKHLTHAKTVIV